MGADEPAGPLSGDQVAAAVAAARPGWRLVEATPIDAGHNVVYRVTVDGDDGRRRALLKCYRPPPTAEFTSPRRFLDGAEIQELVRRESALPVPAVLGVCQSHPDAPAPLVLSERVEGTNARSAGLLDERERLERFARDAGRYLARIHDIREFERFGRLRPADRDLVVDDGHGSWVEHVRAVAETDLDCLRETRFADLESRLRDGLESLLASVEADHTPVLTHGDYAPDNLLVDPATGELTGIVDWELATADDRVHELATAEVYLADWAPADSPRRRRVRDALLSGYGAESSRPTSSNEAADRRRISELLAWLMAMRWFDEWHADASVAERRRYAAARRDAVSAVLEG